MTPDVRHPNQLLAAITQKWLLHIMIVLHPAHGMNMPMRFDVESMKGIPARMVYTTCTGATHTCTGEQSPARYL